MLGGQDLDVRLVEEHIQPSDGIVVDVGAERGEISLHFAKAGFRVIAFEPARLTARALRIRCLRYRRITVREEACGATAGVAYLDETSAAWQHHHLADTGRPVQVVRLADALPKGPVALLKVDAEGHDLEVLQGYFEADRPMPKVTMFEFHRGDLAAPLELLQQAGYRHFRFVCRWEEEPELDSQQRLGIFDGHHPLVDTATSGNAIAIRSDYRIREPLTA